MTEARIKVTYILANDRSEVQTWRFIRPASPIDLQDFTPVSRGIGVDSRGRIWVLSFHKTASRSQIPKDFVIQDYRAFEVYDKNGVLLSRLPFPHEVVNFDNMTMHGDHIFFVDPFDQACVYEYAVVEGHD